MDRDKRWDRVEPPTTPWSTARACNPRPVQAVRTATPNGVTDEFVEPVVCAKGAPSPKGDSVIFFNFRPDRAREMTRAFCR